MKIKCFGCDAEIEAENLEALADAFVKHGRGNHSWQYPESAVRTYACNYAEAVVRLAGDTVRKKEIGKITIYPVTEDSIDDWLQFFDHDGFADNPGWASCYCLQPHLPTIDENLDRPWRESRSIMVKRLLKGETFGYLAYVDNRPAGWVNASLRSEYKLFQQVDPNGPEPASIIGVSCFVVAPPYRRHGIASALLDRVIADAASRGALWIEGYPRNKPESNDAEHFRGPSSMYTNRGFKPVVVLERYTVMRRQVD
jgi:GNAT superfamily N-acetyltransferase